MFKTTMLLTIAMVSSLVWAHDCNYQDANVAAKCQYIAPELNQTKQDFITNHQLNIPTENPTTILPPAPPKSTWIAPVPQATDTTTSAAPNQQRINIYK